MKKIRTLLLTLVFISVLLGNRASYIYADNTNIEINGEMEKRIDRLVKEQMKKSKIPGIALLIINGDQEYKKYYGYEDKKEKKAVTEDTLFELGSNSKAFTGLAILKLEQEGYLNLNDRVDQYIPWFQVSYKGKKAAITIEQLLHHTSGIPYNSIGNIPVDSSDKALEHTVRTVVNSKLVREPGSSFEYATINYDILGFIIETVSGESYEEYMKENILQPLGLGQIYLSREEAFKHGYSNGYKIGFRQALEYEAPIYGGNLPAGYFISNMNEIEQWTRIHLGTADIDNAFLQLIQKSHEPDRTVAPSSNGSSYAAGWSVFQSGEGIITHGGNNPNFSSNIMLSPGDKLGIVVLSNMNSSNTDMIGQSIFNILQHKEEENRKLASDDMYRTYDSISVAAIVGAVILTIICLVFIFKFIRELIQRKRKHVKRGIKGIAVIGLTLVMVSGIAFCLYILPYVLINRLNWGMIQAWGPISMPIACISLLIGIAFVSVYFILSYYFKSENDNPIFFTFILSIASGFGNALLIFIINEALNRTNSYRKDLLIYLFMAIITYVVGQKLVRTKLISVTNNIVLNKREMLIHKILNSSFNNIEKIESGKIQAGLNNDTEAISNVANLIITGLTHSVTLICCFIYLALLNVYAFLLSFAFILVAIALYAVVGRAASMLWQQTRTMQNIFFQFITDLIGGFKELSMSQEKKEEFREDMLDNCRAYRDKRVISNVKFTNVFVIGELLFLMVIVIITFLFPQIFKSIQLSTLKNYVFVLLYMTGPINGLLDTIPNVIQVRVNWKRLNELVSELSMIENEDNSKIKLNEAFTSLELKDISYSYKNSEGEAFCVGPIDFTFVPGEIVFITGGNGSGKSTLTKLLSGLYKPDSGAIYVNDQTIVSNQLGELFSAVLSDYYLFQRLYGVDCEKENNKIKETLKLLRIDHKVQVEEGRFSTLNLSSGQRKRIALLLAYLDEKPIYLFDELAADQDPEFRAFFYQDLLQSLKKQGKCIIAVTHDDRYFHLADRIIKMDMGKLVSNVK